MTALRLTVLLLLILGCKPVSQASKKFKAMPTLYYTVEMQDGGIDRDEMKSGSVYSGSHLLEIEDGRIAIDGKYIITARDGDRLLLTRRQELYVNDVLVYRINGAAPETRSRTVPEQPGTLPPTPPTPPTSR
jgi:hypothetical protein